MFQCQRLNHKVNGVSSGSGIVYLNLPFRDSDLRDCNDSGGNELKVGTDILENGAQTTHTHFSDLIQWGRMGVENARVLTKRV